MEDSESDRTVVPGGLCARQNDLKMEGCVCLWKEGVKGMLDIEILEGFASDW